MVKGCVNKMDIKNISTRGELINCLGKINEIIKKEKIIDINHYESYVISFLLLKVENYLKEIRGRE